MVDENTYVNLRAVGKVRIYDKSTGEGILVYPIDAKELIHGGYFSMTPPNKALDSGDGPSPSGFVQVGMKPVPDDQYAVRKLAQEEVSISSDAPKEQERKDQVSAEIMAATGTVGYPPHPQVPQYGQTGYDLESKTKQEIADLYQIRFGGDLSQNLTKQDMISKFSQALGAGASTAHLVPPR